MVKYKKSAQKCIVHIAERAEIAMSISEAVGLIRELTAAILEAAKDGRFGKESSGEPGMPKAIEKTDEELDDGSGFDLCDDMGAK